MEKYKAPHLTPRGDQKTKPISKFFVVDDDEYYSRIMEAYIKEIGRRNNFETEVYRYADGEACIDNMDEQPDYIILDFYLDQNNDITHTGYDVLEKINKHNNNVNIIIVSQKHEWENFKEEFQRFGASDFLKKDNALCDNLEALIVQNKFLSS